MARLPLIINEQRLRTLDELRENFNLAELIERFRGGQLRAWLYNWDFKAEQELVEVLPADLPDPKLADALCRIFGIEGESRTQALNSLKEEKVRQIQEQQLETQRQQEQQRQEEQRKAEESKPLTLAEIEFDWQMKEGPQIDLLTSGSDRFVAIQNGNINHDTHVFYSYDGLHWEGSMKWRDNPTESFYYCNGYFIVYLGNCGVFHYSSDSLHWKTAEIDDISFSIDKIIWADGHYTALCGQYVDYNYKKKGFLTYLDETGRYRRPIIYASSEISGPWHKEKIVKYFSGDLFTDVTFFNGQFIFTGCKDHLWAEDNGCVEEQFYYTGTSTGELEGYLFDKAVTTHHPSKIWTGQGKCFRCAFGSKHEEFDSKHDDFDLAYMRKAGSQWTKIKYGITDLVDAGSCLVARLLLPDSDYGTGFFRRGKDIGFHISLDGIKWRKLNAPLQKGKMAYLDGKLLIADGNKLAVGTLKVAHKNNTSSTPTHSCNTSTEDRDLHYNVELSAEEAKSGTIKEVTVTRSEICSLCSGSGRESGSGERSCTNCNGCGLVQGSKSIKVRIPADVKSGAKLRVQGQGNAGRGEAQPGDLYMHITVKKEPSIPPSQTTV